MAEPTVPGLGDLFALLGSNNPLTGVAKQVEQFRRLTSEMVKAVENINRTMETLNGTAQRMNSFMDDVEEPLRALLPTVTRSIKTMDTVMEQVSAPFLSIPGELSGMMDTLDDLAKRLQPLTQMAESAGGLFGLRPLASLRAGSGRLQPVVAPEPVVAQAAADKTKTKTPKPERLSTQPISRQSEPAKQAKTAKRAQSKA